MTPRLVFRTAAIAEAITWALLLGGMFVKYGVRAGDLGVTLAGPVHGVVFLGYGVVVLVVAVNQRWTAGVVALGLLSAVVPFGSIPFDRGLERRTMLSGPWRRLADPSERAVDRMLRQALRRPALFAAVLLAGVAAVSAVLLLAGPPGGES